MHRPFTTTTSPSPTWNAPPEFPRRSRISTSFANDSRLPYLAFGPLVELPFLRHAFTARLPDVAAAAPMTHGRIVRHHEQVLRLLGTTRTSLATAQQVHGSRICIVRTRPRLPIPETDGLLTNASAVPLGVYVADCCAVFLVDRKARAIGLLHSGREGTGQNIAGAAIDSMRRAFGTDPRDVLAVLGPCIRACHYEVDIPRTIRQQLRQAGVAEVFDTGVCTACHPGWFYSYRAEKGRTGRMLAVLMLA